MTTREANRILIGDLKLVIDDAEELLRATAGEAGAKVKELRGRLDKALESARANCERLQDKTAEVVEATDRVIRRHPYETIGTAFGVGLIIGVLVARR